MAKTTRPISLIDTTASNIGYRQNNALFKLTYLLSYPHSRDAIASKNPTSTVSEEDSTIVKDLK